MPPRNAAPSLAIASLSMIFIVVWSNWLMQGDAGDPSLPQSFTALNSLFDTQLFVYGQFTFPIAFLITDLINRLFGPQRASLIVAVGALVGAFASIYFATPWIAFASISAFVVGQMLDIAVFQHLRRLAWFIAPLISSLLASLIDTGVFYAIAFGFFGEQNTWVLPTAGVDFGVKAFVALVALLPFRLIIAHRLAPPARL